MNQIDIQSNQQTVQSLQGDSSRLNDSPVSLNLVEVSESQSQESLEVSSALSGSSQSEAEDKESEEEERRDFGS